MITTLTAGWRRSAIDILEGNRLDETSIKE